MELINRRSAMWGLFVTALALTCIGVVMVYSASSVVAQAQFRDGAFFLKRQLAYAVIGLAAMSVAWKVHYVKLRRWTVPLLGLTLLAVILVLFPHIGRVAGGARRWLSLGGVLNFQPAELAKLGMILYLSNFLANRGARVREFGAGLLPPLIVFLILAAALLRQPDLGSALILAIITFVLLFVGGARLYHLLLVGLAAVPAGLVVILHESYRSHRLLAFLDPWKDPQGAGFHIIQSLLALASGGLAGLGLGHSRQKFFYLPERHTDFIFAIIGEELGLVGTTAVIVLFALLAIWGYRIASRIPDRFGTLLCVGLTTMLVGQAALNIGVVTGSVPVTGVPLPFISFGGSSLVFSYVAIGMLLNLSQYAHPVEPAAATSPPRSRPRENAWARG
jgi:cell division protein FtsW